MSKEVGGKEPGGTPQKSNTLLIVLVVIAVLIAIPVCGCGGCIYMTYRGVKTAIEGDESFQEAQRKAETNEKVKELLGEPVTVGSFWNGGSYSNHNGKIDVRAPINGPKGTGTLVVKSGFGSEDFMRVEIGDKIIDLNEDE